MMQANGEEGRVGQLLAEGRQQEAVALLYELVVAQAEAKRFAEAERLRERLIAIDPLALGEIVQSAEIIEAAKAAAIDPEHLQQWAELYAIFNEEEKNAFFYALQPLTGTPGQVLAEQGKLNNRLFLVDSGTLNEIVRQGGAELFLRRISPQEVAAAETFFRISVCTTSIVVEQRAVLRCIERKALQALEERYPGIEEKLAQFCRDRQQATIEELLHKKAIDRRRDERFKTGGEIFFQLVDRTGKPVSNTIRGALEDLSTGGASFVIKCTQPATARLLLGRTCSYKLLFARDGKKLGATGSGVILGVHSQLFHSDYLVNMHFAKSLKRADLEMLVGGPA